MSFWIYFVVANFADDVWKMFIDTAGAMIPDRDQETLDSFTKFVDQLPSVFGQVFISVIKLSDSKMKWLSPFHFNWLLLLSVM